MVIKTYPLLEKTERGWEVLVTITCRVVGEMCDGRKVWYCEATDEQYFLYKIQGHYYFVHE